MPAFLIGSAVRVQSGGDLKQLRQRAVWSLSPGAVRFFSRGFTMTFCEYTRAISEIYEELLALRAETESLRLMIEALTGKSIPRPRMMTSPPRLH